MDKNKSSLSTVIIGIIIIFFVFIFLKGCIIQVWSSPSTPITYSIIGAKQSLKIILLPDNKTIMWQKDINNNLEEAILTEMRGSHGTHYFWHFWKIDTQGGVLPGYRIYPSGTEPVVMETKTIKKYMSQEGESFFPEINTTQYQTILFKKDAIQFDDMLLQKEETDMTFLSDLLKKLE